MITGQLAAPPQQHCGIWPNEMSFWSTPAFCFSTHRWNWIRSSFS